MTISPSLKPHWPERARSTQNRINDEELTGQEPPYVLDIIDTPTKLTLLTYVVDADLDTNPIERSPQHILHQ